MANVTTTDIVASGSVEPIVVKEGVDSVQIAKYAGIGVVAGLAIYGGYRILTDYVLNKPATYPAYPQQYYGYNYGYANPMPVNAPQPQGPVYSYKDQNGVIRNAQTQQPIYTQQPTYVAPQAPVAPQQPVQYQQPTPVNSGVFTQQ